MSSDKTPLLTIKTFLKNIKNKNIFYWFVKEYGLTFFYDERYGSSHSTYADLTQNFVEA